MRFVDEYRDPAAARALVARITELAGDGQLQVHGGLRRSHPHDLPPRHRARPPDLGRARARPRLPGVRHPDGPHRRRHRRGRGTRGDLHVVRRHDARARARTATCSGPRRGAPTSASCTRRSTRCGSRPRIPDRQVVFFAVGLRDDGAFDGGDAAAGQAPTTSMNFTVFSNHVTIVPPIKAILESPDLRLDGFLGPGHVSTVVGQRPYRFVPEVYGKPARHGRLRAARHPAGDRDAARRRSARAGAVSRTSTRAVSARRATRGRSPSWTRCSSSGRTSSGAVSGSSPRAPSSSGPSSPTWDAELRFEVPGVRVADPKACQCGEVLKGVIKPWECKVFGTACTPETPIGTCMVSSEGACAAYYNFGRLHREVAVTVGATR